VPSLFKTTAETALNAHRLRGLNESIHLCIEGLQSLESALPHLWSHDLRDPRTGRTSALKPVFILHDARPIRELAAVHWASRVNRALIRSFEEDATPALFTQAQALLTCSRIRHATQKAVSEGGELHPFRAREPF
jgi:hypothetical protein